MPRKRSAPDNPAEWLNRASSDLAIAQTQIKGAYLEDLCYHAQQCAEKALKAVLLQRHGSFPYIHDLAELANRIEQSGLPLPKTIREAVSLTEYAVEGRYPGFDQPVSYDQWREAVGRCKTVLQWCKKAIAVKKG
jgi:HEPN domain-containing protein